MPRGRPRKDALMKSAELAGWAIGGLEREIANTRERLTQMIAQAAQLRSSLGRSVMGSSTAPATTGASGNGLRLRTMSAAARKAISVKMKQRWAERKRLQAKAAKEK